MSTNSSLSALGLASRPLLYPSATRGYMVEYEWGGQSFCRYFVTRFAAQKCARRHFSYRAYRAYAGGWLTFDLFAE